MYIESRSDTRRKLQKFGETQMETLPGIDSYEPRVVLLSNRLCRVRAENWFGPKYLFLPPDRDYNKEPPNKGGRILQHKKGGAFELITSMDI